VYWERGDNMINTQSYNNITILENYAEIYLYDRYKNIKAISFIDIEDVEKVKKYKWHLDNSTGYVKTKDDNKTLYLHRFVMGIKDREIIIDHKSQIKLDNRKENLRICNKTQNAQNVSTVRKNNTSGTIGITWDNSRNKWVAQIDVNGKHKYLGRFIKIEDAKNARREAELKYFKEYAPINKEVKISDC
jgi:hypothetical protein